MDSSVGGGGWNSSGGGGSGGGMDGMNVTCASFASPLFFQINFLIKSLQKKNYKQYVAELNAVSPRREKEWG